MKSYDDSILLINKDPDIMSTFSVILGEYGYNLSVALDKETAIEIVKQKKIDLIVIDFTYFDIEPSDLFDTIVEIKPEIPRIIMIAKEMFDESHIKKI
ncbi:MAG TPA: response regulator, partial [Spirochaetota bacterium]|nr:response regulator [Spirochaetota bacterium]